MAGSSGESVKMEVDYSAEVDQLIPDCEAVAKVRSFGTMLYFSEHVLPSIVNYRKAE